MTRALPYKEGDGPSLAACECRPYRGNLATGWCPLHNPNTYATWFACHSSESVANL